MKRKNPQGNSPEFSLKTLLQSLAASNLCSTFTQWITIHNQNDQTTVKLTTWVNLKDIMLLERSQTKKKKRKEKYCCMNPFISSLKPGKTELYCLGIHAQDVKL